jgi:thioredoxin reductase
VSDTVETDVIMIGAGPSALAAAVYTTREDIKTILLEKGVVGGLAAITDQVDNYPGFPDGITGLDLAEKLEKQAERFGADIRYGEVSQITTNSDDHTVLVKTIDDATWWPPFNPLRLLLQMYDGNVPTRRSVISFWI